jgi:multidrug efflux pump subunit AcrA (membrane-fusion protein)
MKMNWDDPTFLRSASAAIQWCVIGFASIAVCLQTAKHYVDIREKRLSTNISAAKEKALSEENRIKAERIAKAEENHKQLEALLSKTKAETSSKLFEAEARLAETQKAADAANKRAEVLEDQQRDRVITPEQRARFKEFMAPIAKGKVKIKPLLGERGEPRRYAMLIKSMLEDSGCILVESGETFIAIDEQSGLDIRVKNKDTAPPHAGNLQKAFESVGIEAQAHEESLNQSLENDMVVIYVYKKG